MLLALAVRGPLFATTIVDDSWADGGRDNGADPLDSNWWYSSSSDGIEVSAGALGMVTGSAGRGIHTVFPTQSLSNVGDKLVVTFTFKTPATVGTGGSGSFRVGLFDTLGRTGLDADLESSSSSPNELFGIAASSVPGLPGYVLDMDVGTGDEDLAIRKHNTAAATGRLMGTIGSESFNIISSSEPDGEYRFAANKTYTGSLTVARISETEMEITGSLGEVTLTVRDKFDSADFGMLAFWANSNQFGSNSEPGNPDNGIEFSNVKIESIATPKP